MSSLALGVDTLEREVGEEHSCGTRFDMPPNSTRSEAPILQVLGRCSLEVLFESRSDCIPSVILDATDLNVPEGSRISCYYELGDGGVGR